jgi:hypothetical protein
MVPPRRDHPRSRGARTMLVMARPYLRLHLAHYARTMATATFPLDGRERMVLGPDPHRILFLGDIGVAGYGVLLPGMAMPAQATARLAAATARGCIWTTVSASDMTAESALTAVAGRAARIDVAVLALGIPDALMMTAPELWESQLAEVIASTREQAHQGCRIVLAGIPPVDRFRHLTPAARSLLRSQVRRLNAAMRQMQDPDAGIHYVHFPDLASDRMHVRNGFSFRAMHDLWARAIAPHLITTRRGAVGAARADAR